MARTPLFDRFRFTTRAAVLSECEGLNSEEAMARVRGTRRDFVKGAVALGATALVGRAFAARPVQSITVGVVGAGLAGLACAYELKKAGVNVTVHEASSHAGGRCFSLGGAFGGPVTFPGQVVERGGEFIDTAHKAMLGYAQQFNFAKEDVNKVPGEIFYFVNGQRYPEAQVVTEYRAFVAAMRADLQQLSAAPTADNFTPTDRAFDLIDLRSYLDMRGAGAILRAVVIEAYEAEYGLAAEHQSCLNFLYFIGANKRSRFQPFGGSDERYHLIGGNQQIPVALANQLPGQVRYGERLERIRKTAAGTTELTLRVGNQSITASYDAVVVAIPFSVLRGVALDSSLGLPAWKTQAINQLSYGTNAKLMVGFNGPFWTALGATGTAYADLPNCQTTWEVSPTTASAGHAVLCDYSSGARGANLNPNDVQQEADRFVADLERVFPGANGAAKRVNNKRVAHLEHWPSNPLTLGSYTCYRPGDFTSIAGNEGKSVGSVFFAGEHANSFYLWQGFMEGAALSGKDAAAAILQAAKVGAFG